MNNHQHNRTVMDHLRHSLYNYDIKALSDFFTNHCDASCDYHYTYPFETLPNAEAVVDTVYAPLVHAIPDLERRDYIVMTGRAVREGYVDTDWVGCCGYYTGVWVKPWLDIPPTFKQARLRFCEFYRFEQGKVVEVQAVWDIPDMMMQSGVWPLAPGLGQHWHVPGPATQDGLYGGVGNEQQGLESRALVQDMLAHLARFATHGIAGMELDKRWHEKMNWYGPAGIGTNRLVKGFRLWHQIPFLKAMPNRRVNNDQSYIFGDGCYVGFTGWPGMTVKVSEDGWLGLPPTNKSITMRSLDFWRCENGKIRENWVLIDLLHVYAQLGVDVFARMRECDSAQRWLNTNNLGEDDVPLSH